MCGPGVHIPMGWLPEEQCGRAWGMRATGDPRQPRLLVVSVGGVGTTTMMEELDTIPELSLKMCCLILANFLQVFLSIVG